MDRLPENAHRLEPKSELLKEKKMKKNV